MLTEEQKKIIEDNHEFTCALVEKHKQLIEDYHNLYDEPVSKASEAMYAKFREGGIWGEAFDYSCSLLAKRMKENGV
jgi:hypothetical protein